MSSLIQHNLRWSARVFKEHQAMTKDEFITYAHACIYEGSESLHDMISEAQSEINMFGDSGPGSLLLIRECIDDFNKIADQYERLTGRTVTRPRMPSHRY